MTHPHKDRTPPTSESTTRAGQAPRRRVPPGLRVLIQPDPEGVGLTAAEREALHVRTTAARDGRCNSCGARFDLPHDVAAGYVVVSVEHEPDCPAISAAALSGLGKLGLS